MSVPYQEECRTGPYAYKERSEIHSFYTAHNKNKNKVNTKHTTQSSVGVRNFLPSRARIGQQQGKGGISEYTATVHLCEHSSAATKLIEK